MRALFHHRPYLQKMSFVIFLSAFVLFACSPQHNTTKRLNHFYQVLDLGTQEKFKAGQLEDVVLYLDELSQASGDTRLDLFKQIKDEEAIKLFSNEQLVAYFYQYFYKKDNP